MSGELIQRPFAQGKLSDPVIRTRCGQAAADGDAGAIDALCTFCRGAVESMVFIHGRRLSWVEQQDAVQEALITAVDRFSTFRGEADPCTWMAGVAKNVARNHMRAADRHRNRSATVDLVTVWAEL